MRLCDMHESYRRALMALARLSERHRWAGVDGCWVSPTLVGQAAQPSSKHGSPWASPKLKRLVEMGMAERNERGHYRPTSAGLAWASAEASR